MPALSGLHFVVTRAAVQAEDLARPLRDLGASVSLLPTIGIAPPIDSAPLRQAAASLASFHLLIFTSANAVRMFAPLTSVEHRKRVRVAAIGLATRKSAVEAGFDVQVMGASYIAESLVEALREEQLSGVRVLIPSAAVTRDIVPDELRALGAIVTVVEAYRNVCPPEAGIEATRIFREPLPDWVLFASPSAFYNLLPLIDPDTLEKVRIGSIGPATSAAIQERGYRVDAEGNPHTLDGLVKSVAGAAGGSAVS